MSNRDRLLIFISKLLFKIIVNGVHSIDNGKITELVDLTNEFEQEVSKDGK